MNPTLHAQIITLKKYQAWRTGKDARTMGEVGIKPAAITSALDVVITIAEDHLRDATKMIEPVKVPSDDELLEWAGQEQFFLFCSEDEFLDIARALLAKYSERPSKCSEVAGHTAEGMASQGAQGFRDGYAAALDEAIAQCNALNNDENSERYRAGASWCAERIRALKSSRQQP